MKGKEKDSSKKQIDSFNILRAIGECKIKCVSYQKQKTYALYFLCKVRYSKTKGMKGL